MSKTQNVFQRVENKTPDIFLFKFLCVGFPEEKHYHRPANPFTLDISGYTLSKTLALCRFFKRSSFCMIKRSTFTFVVNRIFLLSEVVRNFLTFISWNPNFHREARCGYSFFTKITLRFLQRGSFFPHPGLLITKNLKGLG